MSGKNNKWIFVLFSVFVLQLSSAQEQGIINNANSPHVKLKSINIGGGRIRTGE
ncbi:MAG: hypothetical protein GY774_27340 [Planctomycetes bacterium]|nr:hypothetical protein [Planctomycetota bacterium]